MEGRFRGADGRREAGEFIKDLDAIANAIASTYGIIAYGVDPRRPNPVVGISASYDDAKLQQLAKGKTGSYRDLCLGFMLTPLG